MRIAAKRLRYVLETTEFCFGKPGADGAAPGPRSPGRFSASFTTAT